VPVDAPESVGTPNVFNVLAMLLSPMVGFVYTSIYQYLLKLKL
jgi:hypothetical protein